LLGSLHDCLTTVKSLSDNSGVYLNATARQKITLAPRIPGWKWPIDETTIASLLAAEDDIMSQSNGDSDDTMSMSMMAAEIEALQHQLEMKKIKMKEKNRRGSCSMSNTMSSSVYL